MAGFYLRRRWTTRLGVLAAAILVAGCGNQSDTSGGTSSGGEAGGESGASGPKTATLTLNWIPYGEHAPFYYGLEKGFYKEAGIDLTVRAGNGSGKVTQAVGGGQSTFGYVDTPAFIKAAAIGVPVRSLGVFLQKTPASVEYFAAKNIKTPADLKGKTVAITAGDAVSQTFPAFLAANNLKAGDVTQVNVDAAGKMAALLAGQVDAITGFYHDQAPTMEHNSGKPVEVLKYSDYGVNFLGTGLIAADSTIESDPAMVKAFVQATIRSWEEAAKNPDAAVAAMSKLAEKAPPPDVLTKQFQETLTLLHTEATEGKPPGVNDAADWQETLDVLAQYASLKEPGKPEDYWSPQFAAEK